MVGFTVDVEGICVVVFVGVGGNVEVKVGGIEVLVWVGMEVEVDVGIIEVLVLVAVAGAEVGDGGNHVSVMVGDGNWAETSS